MITRQQYLNKEATHQEYYAQFVTPGIKQRVRHAFSIESLIDGKDDHFNNIPLEQWVSLLPVVPFEINSKIKQCNDFATKAGVVCILKEAARQIVEENVVCH